MVILEAYYSSKIDQIADVLVNELFSNWITYTKVGVAFFFILYVGYVFVTTYTQNKQFNPWQLLRPILFLILFETCYSGGLKMVDNIFYSIGESMSAKNVMDKVLVKLTTKDRDKIDKEVKEMLQQDNKQFKAVLYALKKGIDKSENWNSKTPQQKAEEVRSILIEYDLMESKGARFWRNMNLLARPDEFWNKGFLNKIQNEDFWRTANTERLSEVIKQIDDNLKNFQESDLWSDSGSSGNWFIDYVFLPIIMNLNLIVYKLMLEIRAFILLILKILGFFALPLSMFYLTSDSWKKFVVTYLEISLWIIPLYIGEIITYCIKNGRLLDMNGEVQGASLETVVLSFAQLFIMFYTPTLVHKILGNQTLQGFVGAIGNKGYSAASRGAQSVGRKILTKR